MAADTSVYMLEEHTGPQRKCGTWHLRGETPCNKIIFFSITVISLQLVPVFQFPISPDSVSSEVSGSSPRLKLRYGRKIYSLDEISLVILFITELHPYMSC